jgi:hypothetical protein
MIDKLIKAPLKFGYAYPITFWALIGFGSFIGKNYIASQIYLSQYDNWI